MRNGCILRFGSKTTNDVAAVDANVLFVDTFNCFVSTLVVAIVVALLEELD